MSCATQPIPESLKLLQDQGPVRLELKPEVGFGDLTDYRSRTITKTFTDGQISRKQSAGVDFTVETKVTHVDPVNKIGTYQLTTIEKEGSTDLSDFAMPELGETFEYVISSEGQVLRAGNMPIGTLYYVPPISLPKEEVRVGDSWPLTADWVSLKSNIPLRMELVSILKNFRSCGEVGTCAEIEVSGDVVISGMQSHVLTSRTKNEQDPKLRFRSEIHGRLLLSLKKGSVLYSIMRSNESLSGEKDSVQISSCLLSFVTKPESDKVLVREATECNPLAAIPTF